VRRRGLLYPIKPEPGLIGPSLRSTSLSRELPDAAWRRRHCRDPSTRPYSLRSFGLGQDDRVKEYGRNYLLFWRVYANISCLFTVAYTVIGHTDREGAKVREKPRDLLLMNTDQLEIGKSGNRGIGKSDDPVIPVIGGFGGSGDRVSGDRKVKTFETRRNRGKRRGIRKTAGPGHRRNRVRGQSHPIC